MKMWFVGETVRNRQDEAALSVTPLGMEAYVPAIIRIRKRGHHLIEEEEPRFGTYIFVRFDRETDRWPELLRAHRTPLFKRILCDIDYTDPERRPRPVPVPDKAMQAIMAYKPPRVGDPTPLRYQPGQFIRWTIAGVTKEGVFVKYVGKTPYIQTWILGQERLCPVSTSELEPVDAVAA